VAQRATHGAGATGVSGRRRDGPFGAPAQRAFRGAGAVLCV